MPSVSTFPTAAAGASRRARRPLFHGGFAAALIAAGTLLALAAPAPAAPTRGFYTQNAGLTPPAAPVPGPFASPWGIAIGAGDSVWVSDTERGGVITAYDSLGGYLSQQTGGGHFGPPPRTEFIRSLSLDDSSGALYVVEGFRNVLQGFDSTGTFLGQFRVGGEGNGEVQVAVDNSGGVSQGRIYTARNVPNEISAFEPSAASTGQVHDFSASGEPGHYIEANRITGTPSGQFGEVRSTAVGSNGDIYAVAGGVADEFEASGQFLRTFTPPAGFYPVSAAVDPTNGNLLLGGFESGADAIDEFDPSGTYLGQIAATPAGPLKLTRGGIAVDSRGFLYVVERERQRVDEFLPVGTIVPEASPEAATEVRRDAATLHAKATPGGGGPITSCRFSFADSADYKPWASDPYGSGSSAGTAPCLNAAGETVGTAANPISSEAEIHAAIEIPPATTPAGGIPVRWRIAVANANAIPRNVPGPDFHNPPAVTELATGPVSELTQQSATLNASFTAEAGLETHYWFEYGTSTNYSHKSPLGTVPATSTGAQALSAPIAGLLPNTTYHYRIVAEDKYGTTDGEDRSFTTFQPPTIESFSASHLGASSARLEARLNPQGFETQCRFEYGTTTSYGKTAPCPEALSGAAGKQVSVEITGLEGVPYHFRVIAENKWGTVASEDQSFEFFPPNCPNVAARQQTGANYLPDCRAYELVSPGDANGTLLYPGGPNTGYATAPSRFSFVGVFSSIPGAGNTIGGDGDLYLATRTDTGWASRYIGLPGSQTGCMAGPPESPWTHTTFADKIQNFVPADPGMGRILDWNDGTGFSCFSSGNGQGDASWALDVRSYAPYLWSADGALIQRLPSGFGSVPGAAAAFACPVDQAQSVDSLCRGESKPSGDLSHLAFSSNALSFAENEATHTPGLTTPPGSAYDNEIGAAGVKLISVLPSGQDIPQDPFYATVPPILDGVNGVETPGGEEEFIRFPAVSTDGSHILMSTATARTPFCSDGGDTGQNFGGVCARFTDTPLHLYMRVDDAVSYEIAPGHAVTYLGMTPDGSRVFFTTAEQLLPEDKDTSTDLYMWSQQGAEEGHPLTLVSKANDAGNPGEAGQSDECSTTWTAKCGVVPYSGWSYAELPGGQGGNGSADSPIAANGDIYFYSPEQLDGDHGVPGQQNLYDYREGRAQYVTTLPPGRHCQTYSRELYCSDGPIVRLQVTPQDTHMAFVTAARLSAYENAGHLEMYSYTPAGGALICDSCNPSGRPASADVGASQDGLFLTEDGRVFFSTAESLVPRDTNEAADVYEFSDGRPRLITPGTGTAAAGSQVNVLQFPGLVAVSADGADVYFSTFDTLTAEDRNGAFLKFYDARTGGGFPQPAPVPPCAAAEECHGPTGAGSTLPRRGGGSTLGGGNVTPGRRHRHRRRHHRHAHRGRHRARDGRRTWR